MTGAINNAPARTSALVTRGDGLRLPANVCVMICPDAMRITLMLLTGQTRAGLGGSNVAEMLK
jgi:hypothetical protein